MSESDDPTVEELENSQFAQLLRESLTLEHLIETGQLVTEADMQDAEPTPAERAAASGEISPRAAAVARLLIEAKRQSEPPGSG
jgi:hypothetical protein